MSVDGFEELAKVKSAGKWVVDESGQLSAVFKSGLLGRQITVSADKLRSLYTKVFNAHSDMVSMIQDMDSERLNGQNRVGNHLDWFSFWTNKTNIVLERKCENLESARDAILATIRSKPSDSTLEA